VRLVDAAALAKDAGSPRSVNMVMAGAASAFLPLDAASLENVIMKLFAGRSPELNVKAFNLGREEGVGVT
jgi:indolepyruvate ferredoxin oxidoreductase beta subunit